MAEKYKRAGKGFKAIEKGVKKYKYRSVDKKNLKKLEEQSREQIEYTESTERELKNGKGS